MRLVLCDPGDTSALWVARHLRAEGLPVEVVTSQDLMRARSWEHTLDGRAVRTTIVLEDGRLIDTTRVRATLNRLVSPRPELGRSAMRTDREYQLQELWALWMSWLHALPDPVLNRATPRGLAGPWISYPEWLKAAARAGLRTPPWTRGDAEPRRRDGPMLFVVAGRVFGPPAPSEVVHGCRNLSSAVRCSLVGVRFAEDWTFAGASPSPDLRRGGRRLLEALGATLDART